MSSKDTTSGLDRELFTVWRSTDWQSYPEAKKALTTQKQRWARDYWLYVHDIVRDKSTETIGIQEAIDVASEAYKLLTGEDIQKWFGKDAALDGVIGEPLGGLETPSEPAK